MPFIDTSKLRVVERLSDLARTLLPFASTTFAHYDFVRGASIHEHSHPQEEVYEVIDGELEIAIDGVTRIARPSKSRSCPATLRIP